MNFVFIIFFILQIILLAFCFTKKGRSKSFMLVISNSVIITVILLTGIVKIINDSKNDNLEKQNNNIVNCIHSDLDLEFLKLENNSTNVIYSPLSIKYGLKMLSDGADGSTKEQIDNVLKDTSITKYNSNGKNISLANAIYIKNDYSEFVKQEYKNKLINEYNAEVKYDNFINVKSINSWIQNKTLGIIKNMLKDTSISNDSKMILINALGIDMEWESQFEFSSTAGNDFYLKDGSKMQATTMCQETSSNDLSYYKDKNVIATIMNLKKYGDTQLEFIAIMPNNDLSQYINSFNTEELNQIINSSKKASQTPNGVRILIPKFSFDYDLNLKQDLIRMGIIDAFDIHKANFENLSNSLDRLYVSDAFHKADIEFTEKGIKAASVTAIVMSRYATIPIKKNEPVELQFNKPFMYFIRDKKTGEIWFVGTVYNPNSWEDDESEYKEYIDEKLFS